PVLATPPFALVYSAIAACTRAPSFALRGPVGSPGTMQPSVPALPNSSSPQLTDASVCPTTASIADVTCAHLEPAPQPPSQIVFIMSSFIDPEASSRTRMSGGDGVAGTSE